VLFFFLALTRWDNLATASPGFLANAGVQTFNLAWIYLITAVVSLVMIVGDRLIRDAIFRSRLKDTIGRKRRLEAIRVQEDIDELVRRLGAARNEESRKVLRTEISEKNKALAAILRGT